MSYYKPLKSPSMKENPGELGMLSRGFLYQPTHKPPPEL